MTFDALDNASRRVAGPTGLQQQSAQKQQEQFGAMDANDPAAAGAQFGALDAAAQRSGLPQWQTGGNTAGTRNGWDTEFFNTMVRQQNEAADAGQSTLDLYGRSDFTGIIAADGAGSFKFGDVYENGKVTGNMLDGTAGFEKADALQVLGQLMPGISSDEYGKMLGGINSIDDLDRRIREEAAKYGQMANNAEAQQAFRGDVQAQKDSTDDLAEGVGTFAAGAGGGAAIGAGIGGVAGAGVFSVPAAGVGAIIGAIVGGFGALINKDTIVDAAAQSAVRVRQAEETGNGALVGGAILEAAGSGLTSAISPLQNWVQGGADVALGGGWNDTGYYDIEDKGLWEQANMAALFGDSLLQFASPVGRAAFMAGMAPTAIGRTTQWGADLASDDDRVGLWDVAQSRFDGADDLGQAAAGGVSVGIDFLQLGMGAFIGRLARSGVGPVASALGAAASGEGRVASTAIGRWMARVADQETHAALRFTVNPATGAPRLIGVSPMILIPSEAVNAVNSVLKAQLGAGRLSTGATALGYQERLYQAATGFRSSARELTLVNGIAEGWEEAVQEAFESLSHGRDLDPESIGRAAISGALAGAGMGAGTALARTMTDRVQLSRINTSRMADAKAKVLSAGGSEEQANEAAEKVRLSMADYTANPAAFALTQQQDASLTAAAREQSDASIRTAYANEPLLHSLVMAQLVEIDKRRTATPGIGSVYRITGRLEGEVPTNHLLANASTVWKMLQDKVRAAAIELQGAGPKASPALQAAVQEWTAFLQQLAPFIDQARDRTNPQQADAAIAQVNRVLRQAWVDRDANGEFTPIAMLVSALISRNPKNSTGSFQMLLPQISAELEREGALDGFLSVSSVVLQAQGADFDGDAELVEDSYDWVNNPAQFRVQRRGAALVSSNGAKIRTSSAQVAAFEAFGVATLNGGADEAIARRFADQMRRELTTPLSTLSGWSEVVDEFITRLLQGDAEAKEYLLNQVHTGVRAAEIEAAAFEPAAFGQWGGNVFHGIETVVNRNAEAYRKERASRRTRENPALGQVFSAVKQSPALMQVAAREASTWGLTLAQGLSGTEPFRTVQKLKYHSNRAANATASDLLNLEPEVSTKEQLEWVKLFSELESGEYRSATDIATGVNEVGRIAREMLQNLYNTYLSTQGDAVNLASIQSLAGMAMDRVERQPDGSFRRIGEWTFAQFALSRAAAVVRYRASGVLERDPNIENKLNTLSNLSFGQAYRELFGQADTIPLLGSGAFSFGEATSFEQARVVLLNLDPVLRAQQEAELKSDARYAISKYGAGYTVEQMANGEVTPFRVFVDALLEETNTYLKLTDPVKGTVGGTRAEADERVIKANEESFQRAYTTLRQKARILGIKDVTSFEQVNAVLQADPDWTSSLAASLDPDLKYTDFAVNADRTVSLPQWFTGLLLESDHRYAAKTLWWQTVLGKLKAYEAGDVTRQSDDRLVRLFIKLGQEKEQLLLSLFSRVQAARTIEESMRIINSMIHFGGPQLAFYRDAAEFDIASWDGGWSRSLPGADLREAQRRWFDATKRWNTQVLAEAQMYEDDQRIGVQLQLDPDLRRQLRDQLVQAQGNVAGITGGELMKAGMALVEGVSEGLTDKAADPKALLSIALNNARGINPSSGEGLIQAFDSRTAYSVEDVLSHPQILQQRSITLETDTGGTFVWNPLSEDDFIVLWNGGYTDPADPSLGYTNSTKYRPLLRTLLMPSAYQYEEGTGGSSRLVQVAMSSDMSLAGILNRSLPDSAWRLESFDSVMKFVSLADAYGAAEGGSYELTRQAVALAQTWAALSRSRPNIQKLMERAFRTVAKLHKFSAEHGSAFVKEHLQTALSRRAAAGLFTQQTGESDADFKLRKEMFRAEISEVLQDDLRAAVESGDTELVNQYNQRADDLMSILQADASLFDRQLRVFQTPVEGASRAAVLAWRSMVQNAVMTNVHIVTNMNVPVVEEFLRSEDTDSDGLRILAGTEKQQAKKWAALSRAAAGAVIQNASSEIGARLAAQALPESVSSVVFDALSDEIDRSTLGTARYFDPSFSFLVEPVLDPASPGARGVLRLRETSQFDKTVPTTTVEEVDALLFEIYDPAAYEWVLHPELSAALVDSTVDRFNSAGVAKAVTYAGSLFSMDGAVAKATERTFADPAKVAQPREYVIPEAVLGALLDPEAEVDMLQPGLLQSSGAGVAPEALAFLNGRFVTEVTLSYVDEAGAGQQVVLGNGVPSASYPYSGANSTESIQYEALTLDTLVETVRFVAGKGRALRVGVQLWHPEDKPSSQEYANNLFFEGLVFNGDLTDTALSLIAAADFGNSGRAANEEPFKAKKKGLQALRPPTLDASVFDLGQDYQMLPQIIRDETLYILGLDLGYGQLDFTLYNMVRKGLTLNRMVRAKVDTDDGAGNVATTVAVYSVEQVLEALATGTQLPGRDFQVLPRSQRSVRTLFGEEAPYGLTAPLREAAGSGLDRGLAWTGQWTLPQLALQPGIAELDANGEYRQWSFEDSKLLYGTSVRRGGAFTLFSQDEETQHAEWHAEWIMRERKISDSRYDHNPQEFLKAKEAVAQYLSKYADDIKSSIPSLAFTDLHPRLVLPTEIDPLASEAFHNGYAELRRMWSDVDGGVETAWVLTGEKTEIPGIPPRAVLSGLAALTDPSERGPGGLSRWIMPGDTAVILINKSTFPGTRDERIATLNSYVRKLSTLGVRVAVLSTDGDMDMVNEVGRALLQNQYKAIRGSRQFWEPRPAVPSRSLTSRARLSRETEVTLVHRYQRSAMILSHDAADEGTLLINTAANTKDRPLQYISEMLPTDGHAGFHFARSAEEKQDVKDALEAMLANQVGQLDMLVELTKQADASISESAVRKTDDEIRAEIATALQRASLNLDIREGAPALPRVNTIFSTGDILVYVGNAVPNRPRRIILSRRGHTVPSVEVLEKQFEDAEAAGMPPIGIYSSVPRQASTSRQDILITGWGPADGSGPVLEGLMELQLAGLRAIVDPDGVKYTTMTLDSNSMRVPELDILPGMPLAYVGAYADRSSKAATLDVVRNYQKAMGFIGKDLTPFYAEAILGVSSDAWKSADNETRTKWLAEINVFLSNVRRRAGNEFDEAQVRILRDTMLAPSTMLRQALLQVPEITRVMPDLTETTGGTDLTAAQYVTLSAIIYLQYRGADVSHVLVANGFVDTGDGARTVSAFLPSLFTESFDLLTSTPEGFEHPIHVELMDGFRERLGKTADGTGFHLFNNWAVLVQNKPGDEQYNISGYLAFPKLLASSESATVDQSSNDRRTVRPASVAANRIGELSLNLTPWSTRKANARQKEVVDQAKVPATDTAGAIFNILAGERVSVAVKPRGPKFLTNIARVALDAYADAWQQFTIPLDREGLESGQAAIEGKTANILSMLNTSSTRFTERDVDTWVRMWTAAPKARDPQSEAQEGKIGPDWWLYALTAIENNLKEGLPPTFNSMLPILSYQHARLFAQSIAEGKFVARAGKDGIELATDDPQEVYLWAIGQANNSPTLNRAFLPAIDGALHTYRIAEGAAGGVPMSVDTLKALKLVDPATDELYLSSDRAMQERLTDTKLASSTFEFGDLRTILGGAWNAETGQFNGDYPPPGIQIQAKVGAWRAEHNLTTEQQGRGDLVRNGTQMLYNGSTVAPWVEAILLHRYNLTLASPAIIGASIIDNTIRGANTALSQLVLGTASGLISRLVAAAKGDTAAKETIDRDTSVVTELSSDAVRGKIFSELQRIPDRKIKGILRPLSAIARTVSFAQDWSIGTRQTTLMRVYWNTIKDEVQSSPDLYPGVDLDVLRAQMQTDGLTVMKHPSGLHNIGLNRLRGMRGLKMTTLGAAMNKVVNKGTNSSNAAVNASTNLIFQMQFMFRNFLLGTGVEYLGLRAADATMAMVFQRLQDRRRIAKAERDGSVPDLEQTYLDEVLDSTNLASMLIRDGITHSQLMLLGMVLGGANLTSGDDPEERRRRRAARAAGLLMLNDPNEIANDLRNADALYFDGLPDWAFGWLKDVTRTQTSEDGEVHSMAQLHWTLKQFLSPALGIAEALETGDIRHIQWGFEDAFMSMPLSQAQQWSDAVETAQLMQNRAEAYADTGDPRFLPETTNLMMDMVWNYERMLLESSFVNQVYQSLDQYDRNPFRLVDVDADGIIQRDDLSQPMDSNALDAFVSDEGVTQSGYAQLDPSQLAMRSRAESRFTVALLGSLVNGLGGQPGMLRQDMAIQQERIDRDELTLDQSMAIIASQYNSEGGEALTIEGAEAIIRGLHMGTAQIGDPGLQNVAITYEQRQQIAEIWKQKIYAESAGLGLTQAEADQRWKNIWYGPDNNPYVTPLYEAVFSVGDDFDKAIPYDATVTYNQLNTTFIQNPVTGDWMATGIGRNSLENFFGNVLGMPSLMAYNAGAGQGLTVDGLLNTTDQQAGLNTGMRALERTDDNDNPTDEDLLKAIQEIGDGTVAGYTPNRYSGYSGGGGGGGYAYRVNSPVRNDPSNVLRVPYVNADNPIIRRATVRRERFSSTRGRLNQWQ